MSIPVFEKEKFAATEQPREPKAEAPSDPRTVPAHVKRAVWLRDGGRGQCTFKSASGKRCACRRGVEFDHIKPVALGGDATIENIRLLCRAHNQLEADRKLGKKLMDSKRPPKAKPEPKPLLKFPHEDELRAALTTLKYTRAEISIGLCASARLAPEATREQRMKVALEALRAPQAKKLRFAKAPASGAPA